MNKIKILFLDHTPFVGGAQISIFEHINQIDKNNFDITVGLSDNAVSLGLVEKYKKINIEVVIFPLEKLKKYRIVSLFNFFNSILVLNIYLRKNNFDLIFCNTVRTQITGSLASLFSSSKSIWFLQDYTFPRLLYKILYFIPQKILYVSESIKNYYTTSDNCKNEVVYIWREFSKFVYEIDESKKEYIKKELKISSEFIIGYIGRLVEWKGPQVLIEAINDLVNTKKIKHIKCLILGTGKNQQGDNENNLKKMVEQYKINDQVVFLGHRNDVPDLLKIMDIFCLTSIEPEPFSSTVIESMLAKIPVIATNNGGTPEIVIDNTTGLLVRGNDSMQLSDAIEKIIVDDKLRKNLSENAFRYVAENNTTEVVTKRLENLYKYLVYS
jgi:glycosyltransferase involved in cell wall biosynthesis